MSEASATKKQKTNDGNGHPTQHDNDNNDNNNNNDSKFNLSSDVDDMVSELLKEELQLVLTRVLRDDPQQDTQIKKQILKVLNARNKTTPPTATALKQLEAFAATFRQSQLLMGAIQATSSQRLSATATATAGTATAGGDLTLSNTIDPTQLLLAHHQQHHTLTGADLPFFQQQQQQQQAGVGGAGDAGALQDLLLSSGGGMMMGGVNLMAIRRKVRDAFISNSGLQAAMKRGRFGAPLLASDSVNRITYRIDTFPIRAEKEKAKEKILNKGEIRDGLNIMEAITSEYVTRGNELGVNNIDGYEEMLREIAKDWVEIFLFESLDIEQEERVEWAKKLFDWDTSANEEEGTFSTARYAAKLAWNNVHLKNVMKGESIGKFSEPKDLSIERLNQLERDNRYEEGMNLAKAVDLDFYLARFLIKLDRVKQAQEVAEKLEDVSQLFSIAQLARALDVDVAFNLALKSVALALEWNNETADRARWLLDLAISNKKTDLLVDQLTKVVVHKTVQYRIAQILKEKEQYAAALSLAKVALKRVPLPEFKPHEPAVAAASTTATASPPTPGTLLPAAASPSTPNQLIAPSVQITAQQPKLIEDANIVPSDLPQWVWLLAHEMLVLDLIKEPEMYSVLDFITENVNSLQTLIGIMNVMNQKREFDQMVVLGSQLLQRIEKQRALEIALQKSLIQQLVDNPETELGLALRTNAIMIPLLPQDTTPNLLYNTMIQNEYFREWVTTGTRNISPLNPQVQIQLTHSPLWDQLTAQVITQMIRAALDSRVDTLTAAAALNPSLLIGIRPVKPMSDEKLTSMVREIIEKVDSVDLLQTIDLRQEYSLAIEVLDKAQRRVTEIRQEKKKRDDITRQLTLLREEAQTLAVDRKTLKPDQLAKMKELDYQVRVYALESPNNNLDVSQYDYKHYAICQTAILKALEAKEFPVVEKQLSSDQVNAVIDRHLGYVINPTNLRQLMSAVASRNEYELVNKIGFKALDIIQDLKKAKKEREELYVPIQIIEAEQEELLEKRQQLPATRLQQLKKLLQDYEARPDVEHFDSDNFDEYESTKHMLGTTMVRVSLGSKVQVTPTFGFGGIPQVAQKEPLSDERIQFIIMEVLNYLESPTNMFDYAKECANRKEYDLMLQIGDKALAANKEIAAQREAREEPKLQYEQLKAEKAKLIEQKKPLKPDLIKQLADMEVEQKINDQIIPKFAKKTLNQYDGDAQSFIKLMLTTLLAHRENLKYRLKELIQSELTRTDDQMQDDEVDPKIEVNENIESANKKIATVIDRLVEYIKNPNHIYALANTLGEYNEFDIVLRLGKVIQSAIPTLLEGKKQRDAVRQELEDIEQEERDLLDVRKQMKNKRKKLDADKTTRMQELQIQVGLFKISPEYLDFSPEVFDSLHLNTAILLILGLIKAKNLENQEMELQTDKTEEDKQAVRDGYDTRINEIVDQCMPFVTNPKHILTLIDRIKGANIALTFKFGKYAIEQATKCEAKKKERSVPEQLIQIIRREESDLELLRKQLPDDVQKQLDDAEEQLNNLEVEYYVLSGDYNDFNNWKFQAINKMLSSVLTTKAELENRIAFDHSLTPEQITKETEELNENLKVVVDLLCDPQLGVKNPNNLQTITSTLSDKTEYKQAIHVGEYCLNLLEQYKKDDEERKLPEQQYALLVQEKAKALQQRNQLPVEQQNELRRLALKHYLLGLEPGFAKQSQDKYDSISFAVSRIMINAALDLKKSVDDRAEADSQMADHVHEEEAAEASKFLESIVDKCIAKVSAVENLIRILQDMAGKYEYGLVLRIGAYIQKNVLELKKQVARIKELEEEQQKLLQQSKIQRTMETEKRLGEIQAELSNLPLKYKGFYTLDNFTLTVSKLMMNAAKVEEDNDILLEQAIITFKIAMTSDAFGEVKVLTPEDQWDKSRIQLLDYVLKHMFDEREAANDQNVSLVPGEADEEIEQEESEEEEDDQSDYDSDEEGYGRRKSKRKAPKRKAPAKKKAKRSASSGASLAVHRRATMKEKLQLLLDEGMWQNVVAVFPDPANGGTIELLERIYIEIKKHNPDKIDSKVLQLVEQYVTREYQEFELENSKSLLDMVEKDSESFIEGMYERISENLLQTLVQKQYNSFVDFLKVVRERLLKYGEPNGDDEEEEEESDEEDTKSKRRKTPAKKKAPKKAKLTPWEKFFTNLTTKHKTKKKLMSLINMQPEFSA